ncbi:MAG: aromatic acid exporter family protein [Candidatus Methylacidiphilales bacterium]|nr:FUSC family protein [Candidatus Methylacidiphilales bacterium]
MNADSDKAASAIAEEKPEAVVLSAHSAASDPQIVPAPAPRDRLRLVFRPNGFEALVFSARAAIAASLAYEFYSCLGQSGVAWATISALIVMQPTLHGSMRASMVRCLANLVGAFAGAVCSITLGHNIMSCMAGIMLTGLLCHYFHLDASLPSAYAGCAIVILTVLGEPVWHGSLDRVLAVVTGCAMALIVTYLTDLLIKSRMHSKTADATE